jgi:hypothetical protein
VNFCPLRAIPRIVFEVIADARRYYRHGLAPVHGGTRDQAALFLAAADFVQGDDARQRDEDYEQAMKRIRESNGG